MKRVQENARGKGGERCWMNRRDRSLQRQISERLRDARGAQRRARSSSGCCRCLINVPIDVGASLPATCRHARCRCRCRRRARDEIRRLQRLGRRKAAKFTRMRRSAPPSAAHNVVDDSHDGGADRRVTETCEAIEEADRHPILAAPNPAFPAMVYMPVLRSIPVKATCSALARRRG